MKRVARWWMFWVTLFARKESASGLAAFRIALGLVVLYSLLSIMASGLIAVLWIDVKHGGFGPLGPGNWLLAWLGGPTPGPVYGMWTVALCGALAMVVGIGGRVSIFVTLQAYNALITINSHTSGGYDLMITNALWLLVFSECMATYSLSCRRKTGAWARAVEISAWPRYLIVFQLLAIYTATGLYKLSADWTPAGGYSALYHVYQDPTWRRFDMDFTASVYPLTQIATAMTWHWETSAWLMFLVYYFRYTRERPGRLRALSNRWDLRVPYVAVGLCMHLGILITLNVGPFSWVAFAYYICLFQPDEVERAIVAVRARIPIGRISRNAQPPTEAAARPPAQQVARKSRQASAKASKKAGAKAGKKSRKKSGSRRRR